ncbi:hypothetical protein BS50DRAFT_609799, partial [Corynespora cassiicola Philippines]
RWPPGPPQLQTLLHPSFIPIVRPPASRRVQRLPGAPVCPSTAVVSPPCLLISAVHQPHSPWPALLLLLYILPEPTPADGFGVDSWPLSTLCCRCPSAPSDIHFTHPRSGLP